MCLVGLFIQFSHCLGEIHSRGTEGDRGDTSQQAESCSGLLPRKGTAGLMPGHRQGESQSHQAEVVTGGTAAGSHSSGHHI